ncbi:MAG: antitoxin [Burkholderiales bacterium]
MSSVIRTAKVFRNGGSQAIRLPKDLRVSGDEVLLKQDYGLITILPMAPRDRSLLELLKAIGPIDIAPRDQPGWTDQRSTKAFKPTTTRKRPPRGKK